MAKTDTYLAHSLNVFDIQRFCLHDGPGIRTTVFLKGCNLHCPWCANPESQSAKSQVLTVPESAHRPASSRVSGGIVSVESVLATVLKDFDYYQKSGGGLTVSGGEPTLQHEGLVSLLTAAKAAGLHTAIETCGDALEAHFAALEPLVDCFLFDIKHTDAETLKAITGGNLARILRNLEGIAATSPHKISLRVPLVPGFNADSETVSSIFDLAIELKIARVDLLPYHVLGRNKYEHLGRDYPGADIPLPDRRDCEYLRDLGIQRGLIVSLP